MKRSFSISSLILGVLAAAGLHAQTLSVDKTSMTFSAQSGGARVAQTLNISSSTGSVSFFATSNTTNPNWLTVNPQTGSTPSAVTVTADPAGLNPGTYGAQISIFVGSTVAVTVPVSFTVSSIGASPQSLQFSTVFGTTPASQTITLSGTSSFTATASSPAGWLTVGPTVGTSPTTLIVSLNNAVVPTLSPGTYTGAISITPAASPTLTVAVTLTVTPTPPVTVSPASLNLGFQIGGTNNAASQNLTVATTAGQSLSFTVSSSVNPNPSGTNWITVTPSSVAGATGSAQVAIAYNTAITLPVGTYTGNVQISTPGFTPATTNVPVTLLVSSSPLLVVPTAPLNFTYQLSGALPLSQSVTATATTGTIAFTVGVTYATNNGSWIVVTQPATGFSSGTAFSVSVNPAGLLPGTYSGTVTVTPAAGAAGNGPQQIPVTLTVANDALILANGCAAASATCSLSFAYQIGQAAPASQNLNVNSSTGTQLNYTATATTTSCGSWLGLTGSTGLTNGVIAVSVLNPTSLTAATCNGTISIAATNPSTNLAAPNSPLIIPVTLYVSATSLLLVSPASVTLTVPVNGQASQPVSLTSTSSLSQLSYTVAFTTASGGSWLSINQLSGNTPNNGLQITATPGPILSAGTYTGSVTVTATGPGGAAVANSPVTIPVTLQVTAGTLSVSPTTLSFNQIAGAPTSTPQTVQVLSTGQPLSYTAVASTNSSGNWLSVSPSSGTTNGSFSVSVDSSKLTPGTYTGVITVTAAGPIGSPISGNPATVQVTLVVTSGQVITATPATLTFNYVMGATVPAAQQVQAATTGSSIPLSVTASTKDGVAWLSVTPATGATPAAFTVAVSPQTLAAGTYTGAITISSPGATPATVPVTLTVVAVPTPVVNAITNAASGSTGGVSPGENVTIFGTGIGPATLAGLHIGSGGTLDTLIGGTRVLFDGVAAPVIYASALQTSVMVPYGVAGRTSTTVQVEYLGVRSTAIAYNVVPAAPGIYSLNLSGTGPGATLNQNGVTVNSPGTPAPKGSVVEVFMTGEGQTSPVGVDGAITPLDGTGLKKPNLTVTATVGGVTATVLYAGSAPGIVSGAMQVNLQIPANAPSGGAVPLVITVGTTPCQSGITVAVQ